MVINGVDIENIGVYGIQEIPESHSFIVSHSYVAVLTMKHRKDEAIT